MKKTFFFASMLLASLSGFGQHTTPAPNLDFEKWEKGVPIGWESFGSAGYVLDVDSLITKSGRGAATIASGKDGGQFKAWALNLPANYPGKKITLTGFIKTENVTGGYAGLWMRIDPEIAFDNMQNRGVKGTTDWKQYQITLDMNPARTKRIVVGGLLVGSGKMWLDDLKVTIDGKDLSSLKQIPEVVFPADKDTVFKAGYSIARVETQTPAQLENLKILGLVWGFLKYYHPAVAAGKYNWDAELFRILPKITSAADAESRDKILLDWIDNLGGFEERKKLPLGTANTKYTPDLKWINSSDLSHRLVLRLMEVKNAVRPIEHYYVQLAPQVENPVFKNEDPYRSMKYPDAGYRLLALYRYWNAVQYFFPSRSLMDTDWNTVLPEFIPKVAAAANDTAYALTLLELVGRIQDTHAVLQSSDVKEGFLGTRYVPLEITFVEDKPVVTAYFEKELGRQTGLQKGDEILRINGVPVAQMIAERRRYNPASNGPTQLRNIARDFLRTNDSTMLLTYRQGGKEHVAILKTFTTKEVKPISRYNATDTSFRMLPGNIAYINNGTLKNVDMPKIQKSLAGTKALIIDDRNYPSDFPIYNLSAALMPQKMPFVKFTVGSLEDPGTFSFRGEPLSVGQKRKDFYKGKVIILVNETTQSSAEFHAMAYRTHPNATVVGSTTAGADGNVSAIYFPGGMSTWISGLGVYYPDGRETQRIGIVPDVEVKPTIAGIAAGKDEVLEKALEIINGQ